MEEKPADVKIEYDNLGFIKDYGCPHCGSKVKLHHEDDIGTRWFKCEKCGEYSARLKTLERKRLEEELEKRNKITSDPNIFERFMTHLSVTIKRDEAAKRTIFLTGISAYTKDPINLFLRGESSIGKTYNTTEALKYFPQEDVWMLGALSPKALIHEYGVLVDQNGELILPSQRPSRNADAQEMEAWNERLRNARYVVDLQRKILVFLEAPNRETYEMLRPILSHDKFEIAYKFTDPEVMRTKTVIIRGWPATIFCSTEERYIQDLATRGFTVTPETESEKYREANILTGKKEAFPWVFKDDGDLRLLQDYIEQLKHILRDVDICIPYGPNLAEKFPSKHARTMRDYKRLLALIGVYASFHYATRPVLIRYAKAEREYEEKYILAIREDYERIFDLWRKIAETTFTGLPGHVLNFFDIAVRKVAEVKEYFSIGELTEKYNEAAVEKKEQRHHSKMG